MTATYDSLATTTLTSEASGITFSSISGNYTDLVLVFEGKHATTTAADLFVRFNSDSNTNYNFLYFYGNGTTRAVGRQGTQAAGRMGYFTTPGTQDGYMGILNILNYSNTTTHKTFLSKSNSGNSNSSYKGAEAVVNVWRSTAAITSVSVLAVSGNLAIGSMATLYGIKAE